MTECPKCGEKAVKWGKRKGVQRYRCGKGHVFSLESEPQPQPQQQPLYTQEQEDARDVATEIIGTLGVGKKQPEQEQQYYEQPEQSEREKRKQPESEFFSDLNPKDFNAPRLTGRFIGETIGDLLNAVFFKNAEKKKEHEQSEQDYI